MADWVYAANEAAGKPRASIVAMPDSGFWPESQRSAEFRGWFALQGNVTDGLPKNCKYATAGSDVSRCLFPECECGSCSLYMNVQADTTPLIFVCTTPYSLCR